MDEARNEGGAPAIGPASATASAPRAPEASGATPDGTWLERRSRAWLTCAALVAVAFLPVLHGYYLHTDDYFWAPYGGFTAGEIMRFMTMVGRPLAGILFWLFSHWPGGMASMNLLRLLSVLNLACLAYMYFRWLRTWQVAPWAALGLAIVVITQPPFQAYAAFLCTAAYGLAFALAALGTLMTQRALATEAPYSRRARFALAALAYLASVSIYQPAPFLVFALLAVPILVTPPPELWARWRGPALRHAAVFAIALAVYYVLWRAWAHTQALPSLGKYDNRAMIGAAQLPDRLRWLVTSVLGEVMSFWRMTPSRTVQIAAFAVAGTSAIIDFDRRAPGQWLLKYAVIAACGVACFAPSLASSAPSLEYRTYGAASTFWVLVIGVGAVRTAGRLRAPARAIAAACLAVAVAGIVWAHDTVTEYFVTPDGMEFLRVRQAVRTFHASHPGAPIRYVHVIPTPTALIVRQQRNEFGEPSVRHAPNIRPIVLAALAERGLRDRPRITVDTGGEWVEWGDRLSGLGLASHGVPPSEPADTVVVDMRDLVLY